MILVFTDSPGIYAPELVISAKPIGSLPSGSVRPMYLNGTP